MYCSTYSTEGSKKKKDVTKFYKYADEYSETNMDSSVVLSLVKILVKTKNRTAVNSIKINTTQ